MERFKVGDRVRIIDVCSSSAHYRENKREIDDIGQIIILDVIEEKKDLPEGFYYIESGSLFIRGAKLELVERSAPMSKYTELKQRIENLNNGWDKEADDILQELSKTEYYLCIKCLNEATIFRTTIEIQNNGRHLLEEFYFSSQCEKLKAFKSALLWLLDHSNIKKDEKQGEINILRNCIAAAQKTFEAQVRELERQIKELE